MRKQTKNKTTFLVIALVGILAVVGLAFLPPVQRKLNEIWTDIRFALNPPDEAVFVPNQQTPVDWMVTQTMEALLATPTVTPVPLDASTPTVTSTPLPPSVTLPGVVYVDQHNRWNYCGPANLAMALNFWGWPGNRDDIAAVVKPGYNDPNVDFITRGEKDLNVMAYELGDFVNGETEYRALGRYGGDRDLLRRLLVAGFPAVIEKGYFAHDTTGHVSWMGHYEFVTGYDDASGTFLVQDAYDFGPNYRIPYDEFDQGWRAFNFLFYIVYPPEREEEVYAILGNWGDPAWAGQRSLEVALRDTAALSDPMDQYFAWFNVGTAHVQLMEYVDAANAYDYAFQLYNGLQGDNYSRPYRMLWYQTGPYKAYYYSGRYQDVIDLANLTLSSARTGPTLEESLYWRGLAYYAVGDVTSAYADIRQTVYLNPNFQAGWSIMQEWGITP